MKKPISWCPSPASCSASFSITPRSSWSTSWSTGSVSRTTSRWAAIIWSAACPCVAIPRPWPAACCGASTHCTFRRTPSRCSVRRTWSTVAPRSPTIVRSITTDGRRVTGTEWNTRTSWCDRLTTKLLAFVFWAATTLWKLAIFRFSLTKFLL